MEKVYLKYRKLTGVFGCRWNTCFSECNVYTRDRESDKEKENGRRQELYVYIYIQSEGKEGLAGGTDS